jgi:SAM-dependent methyltransferase
VNSYHGLHARYYDLVYQDKPYADEAAFVGEVLRGEGVAGGRLLDVACGTGRHAAEFVRLGFDVTGVDYNEELIAIAREQVPDAAFLVQDMCDLRLDEEFDAVTSLFDSIGYPLTDEKILVALESMRGQLRRGGLLVIEFLHAPAFVAGSSPVRVRRWRPHDDETLLRISETAVDACTNVFEVSYELLLLDERANRYERWQETQRNRAFELDEMRGLLDRAGLDALRFLPAYQRGSQVDETTWHVLGVATA